MNRDLRIVLIILIVNFILSVIYLVVHFRKKTIRKGLLNFFFFLIFPGVGLVFMALAELVNLILHGTRVKGVSTAELSFSTERMHLSPGDDVDKKINIVPIEEALIVSDRARRHQNFIDVLKSDDHEEMMDMIKDAVENDDTEISHYAASIVTDTIARQKAREEELRAKAEESADENTLTAYISYVTDMMTTSLFSLVEKKLYTSYLDRFARMLYEKNPSLLTDRTICVLVDTWRAIGDDEKVSSWIACARIRCRHSLV